MVEDLPSTHKALRLVLSIKSSMETENSQMSLAA